MTEEKRISELLERYWEGETTLSEERELKAYFNEGAIYPSHREYEPYFTAVRKERLVQAPARFHISRTVKYWLYAASVAVLLVAGWFIQTPKDNSTMAEESSDAMSTRTEFPVTYEQPVQVKTATDKPAPVKIRKTRRVKTAAATVDPETQEAMIQVKAALALVSSSIKKTRREVSKGTGHLETMDLFHKRKGG